jgi:surfeit locus 1 family protein
MGWWPGSRAIAPFHKITRLVADPPLAGLAANAAPDPSDIPNNHLAYAVQWFLFAGWPW